MKKRSIFLLLAALVCMAPAAVFAENGDVIGHIYSTDIAAYIGKVPIDSYNIGGKTVIIAEDLDASGYGHSYEYDDDARLLNIRAYFSEPWGEYAEIPRGKTGKILGEVYATDIQVTYNGIPVTGYNIGGRTAICIEELGDLAGSPHEAYGYSKYLARHVWDEENRSISLHSFTSNREDIMGLNLSRAKYTFSDNVLRVVPDDTVVHSSIEVSMEGVPLENDAAYESGYATHWFSEDFGDAKYVLSPLYLQTGDTVTEIGSVVTVRNRSLYSDPPGEIYEDTHMHIDDPESVLALAKSVRTPMKSYEEAMAELTEAYTEVKRLELPEYTVLHLKDEAGTDLVYALKKTGGCLLIDRYGDDYIKERTVDILPGDEPHQSVTTFYPFADPHGKPVTMHGIHDLSSLCFD